MWIRFEEKLKENMLISVIFDQMKWNKKKKDLRHRMWVKRIAWAFTIANNNFNFFYFFLLYLFLASFFIHSYLFIFVYLFSFYCSRSTHFMWVSLIACSFSLVIYLWCRMRWKTCHLSSFHRSLIYFFFIFHLLLFSFNFNIVDFRRQESLTVIITFVFSPYFSHFFCCLNEL